MLNVLLVDDDSEFSDVVCHIVEFLGHNINTAANLAEAEPVSYTHLTLPTIYSV